jgi:hypothetical protein
VLKFIAQLENAIFDAYHNDLRRLANSNGRDPTLDNPDLHTIDEFEDLPF